MVRHEFVATREDSLLLIIDFQEAMLKVIDSWETIARKVGQIARAANTLGIPILLTEQYKQGLGETIPEVLREITSPLIFQKDHFSACLERDFLPTVQSFRRDKVVVVGMETHVCVLQTGLDLLKQATRFTWWRTLWHPERLKTATSLSVYYERPEQ